jgi:hypothetical protein
MAQVNWPKVRGQKGNPAWYGDKDELDREAKEYEKGIKRNIKIIEGVDEKGNPIIKDLRDIKFESTGKERRISFTGFIAEKLGEPVDG